MLRWVMLSLMLLLSSCAPDAVTARKLSALYEGLSPAAVQQQLGRAADVTIQGQYGGSQYMAALYPMEKGKGWRDVPSTVGAEAVQCQSFDRNGKMSCPVQRSDFPNVVLTNQALVLIYQVRSEGFRLYAWGTVQSGLFKAYGGGHVDRRLWGEINTALLPDIQREN